MKVGIIADTATGCSGINRYSYNLIEGLSKSNEIDELKVYGSSTEFKKEISHFKQENLTFKNVRIPFKDSSLGLGYRQLIKLPKILKDQDLDIIQDNYAFGPFLNLENNMKKVIVVHDVAPYIYKYRLHYFKTSFISKNLVKFRYEFILPKIMEKVDSIITISENSKKDLINYFDVPPSKIHVIYHGIDHRRFHKVSNKEINKIVHKYSLNENNILLGCINSDRKIDNVHEVLKILSILIKKHKNVKLLLIGQGNFFIEEVIKKLGLSSYVIKTGYVPEDDLPILYNIMDIFLFLSEYEGFGFPPLEAMACGTPVVALNRSSMPEIIQDSGILLNQKEPQYIAKIINQLIEDDSLRNQLKNKGIKRSKEFKWENTIKSTLKVYGM